ncbi:hypothetical protein SK3146_06585 [Paenibacillus konkukensis]|uniref:Tyr recombinase domain-containing protein n=1 Tax=Paenibacillus konkukensis TaxID=2020716 RepID=A0ABY4RYH6_9BACL|nr:hypothetical protein SK3146_06585 [Paenibacillus konkukensis]
MFKTLRHLAVKVITFEAKEKDNEPTFARIDKSSIRLAYPNEKLLSIIEKHQLHPITIHCLRHTHASLLFETGVTSRKFRSA